MAKLTPMMHQYLEIKDKFKDCILFFRLGDFYEMFFEDAIIASKQLEITLTGKDCGQKERAPMCGVPYHSAENYIQRLIEKGHKVAICEQMEDPKACKGIVKRDVVRIVTPGTNLNTDNLQQNKNNYIMCIDMIDEIIGISTADVSTGEFKVTEVNDSRKLLDEIAKFMPSEIIVNECIKSKQCFNLSELIKRFRIFANEYSAFNFNKDLCERNLCDHFEIYSLDGLGLSGYTAGVTASGALLNYLNETQKRDLKHISKLTPYSVNEFMMIDLSTRRNLELTETLREKNRKGSLLWVLDKTCTAMGGRLLRKWIEQPLLNSNDINKRLSGVEELKDDIILRDELKEELNGIYDIERLLGKISFGSANARDLIALKSSVSKLPLIKQKISTSKSDYLKEIFINLNELKDIFKLIDQSVNDDPPLTLREGRIIKDGFDERVDNYRKSSTQGKIWISELEAKEREITGIRNLKIKYNKVFGYYLEVTKSNLNLVPDRYIRKQTLTNAERYITDDLKKIEDTILGAEDKVVELEYKLFIEIRDTINQQMEKIQKTALQIAKLDAINSLAEVAEKQNYIRPTILQDGVIEIEDGRHPVVEKMMDNDQFISNNTYLNDEDQCIAILTGPNMAGKSTYMRQVALIVLMAQIGSFVPANKAKITVTDRIFTRVGASDDLASGQSTFMVEMTEVANILNNATKDSLLILDEIGRGTSTYDGLSIAWAVIEYISDKKIIGAKTLFATHYHELTQLEGKIKGVKNYCVTVKENGEDIVFLRKIKQGSIDQSYGIEVAKLAGLPKDVVERSKQILLKLSEADRKKENKKAQYKKNQDSNNIQNKLVKEEKDNNNNIQLNLFDKQNKKFLESIQNLNLMEMTPMQAMQTLYDIHIKSKQLK